MFTIDQLEINIIKPLENKQLPITKNLLYFQEALTYSESLD